MIKQPMKRIAVWLLIASVRLVKSSGQSNETANGLEGLCGCETIDPRRYEPGKFSSSVRYRIENGTIVHENDLRWVAGLFVRFCGSEAERATCESPEDYHYRFFCTGVLLNRYHVFTAGHVRTRPISVLLSRFLSKCSEIWNSFD